MNHFQRAISRLSEMGDSDFKKFAHDMAIKHPSIFCRVMEGDLNARLRELYAEGRKIEAIKLHREKTGSSLKDAKEYVERL